MGAVGSGATGSGVIGASGAAGAGGTTGVAGILIGSATGVGVGITGASAPGVTIPPPVWFGSD